MPEQVRSSAASAQPDIVDVAAANPAVGKHVDGVALMNALAGPSAASERVECGKCRRSFTVDEFFDHHCPAKDSADD